MRLSSPPLLLASQSPRRRELLQQIGVSFTPLSVTVPEQRAAHEAPAEYVRRLARDKARAGLRTTDAPEAVVLGADTLVVCDEHILEKPRDREHAVAMLTQLGGRTHQVMTAVALVQQARTENVLVITEVTMRPINRDEAEAYWATGEPADKAGGYGIQGLGAVFVSRVQGSYSAVVGLPLFETAQLLAEFAIPCWQFAPSGDSDE